MQVVFPRTISISSDFVHVDGPRPAASHSMLVGRNLKARIEAAAELHAPDVTLLTRLAARLRNR